MSRETLGYVLALIVIGFSLYAADLNSALIFDDEHFIIENVSIREITLSNVIEWFTENSLSGSERMSEYYRPLLLASFAVNYAIDGLRPFGYHLLNNLIHIANSFLVFWLIFYGFKRKALAFLVALVFLIHPMQSEGVAYVSGRGDLMSSLFMLTGLLAWLKGIEGGRRLLTYGISSLCLILALLSRENAIIFPFLAIVVYISFISCEPIMRAVRNVFFLIWPHLVIVALYLLLRLTVLNFRNFLNFGNIDAASAYVEHLSVRLYTFLHVLVEYVQTFLWPTNVHERLTFPIHESFFDWPVWATFAVLFALGALLVWLYREKNDDFRLWFFASGWFFVALVPASGIIPTNVIIQDHRLYLAMIGIATLCFYYLSRGLAYAKAREAGWLQVPVLGALSLYLAFISLITVERAIIWGRPTDLFEETLRYEPNALIAYNMLGHYYFREGEYQKAERNFIEAIRRGTRSSLPYYNLGYLYDDGTAALREKAIFYYKKALEMDSHYKKAKTRLRELNALE